jgi:hypothetical protein
VPPQPPIPSPQPPLKAEVRTHLQSLAHAGLWCALVAVALAHALYILIPFLTPDDSDNLETPLAMAAAGQLTAGPETLYGPFSRRNPRVLIHAPLYYRLTGLLAWPLVSPTMDAISACMIAGRTISVISFLACLAVTYRLARFAGSPKKAGVWAACLAASTWIATPLAVTVRPDMLGVALQTAGLWLVLRAKDRRPVATASLVVGGAAFGLAICVKQHDVVEALVAAYALAATWRRRRDARGAIGRAAAVGIGIVVADYLFENLVTSGMMGQSVFEVPARMARYSSVSWKNPIGILFDIMMRSLFPLTLWAIGAWVGRGHRPAVAIDRWLKLALLGEVLLIAVIAYNSSGAWVNYGLQAVVLISILAGRALAFAVEGVVSRTNSIGLGVAAVVILGLGLWGVLVTDRKSFANHAMLFEVLNSPRLKGRPRDQIYFVGLPQYNRLFGRLDLAHDEWLYGMFERAAAAEPREYWLRPELTSGSIRVVIVPNDPPFPFPVDPPVVPGLSEPLPRLGYDKVNTIGRFQVWERRRSASPPGRSLFPMLGPE